MHIMHLTIVVVVSCSCAVDKHRARLRPRPVLSFDQIHGPWSSFALLLSPGPRGCARCASIEVSLTMLLLLPVRRTEHVSERNGRAPGGIDGGDRRN